jgi:pimeloyl-ACP methyl ester carboxylesterase
MATRTFVLLHGAWHGAWSWRRVADRLRDAGHRVFTPTFTGLGERSHLLSSDVGIETFVSDVANVLTCEELDHVVLVGQSFSGLVMSILADRMPERLSHLVFLDGAVVPNGACAFDELPPDIVERRKQIAATLGGGLSLPPPPASAFGLEDPADIAWVERRLTPHPIATFLDPIELDHPLGNGLPRTYVECTAPSYPPFDPIRARLRADPEWTWLTLATAHDAMISAPEAVASLLLALPREPEAMTLDPS